VSRRASFLRHLRGAETAIFGASIFHRWKGPGVNRSELQLAAATQIDGHTSKVRVDAIFPDELGQIDLFIHDSLHSERNVRFELNRAWPMLGPKGARVVDDVDANWGFRLFSQTTSGQVSWICEAEPLRPDLRRFNKKVCSALS
jgi:hypothetical protein